MNTQQLTLSDADIKKAAQFIKEGELVAFPTETVYGLGADAFHPDAVEKIYSVKGRPSDNPLIVHIAHMNQLPLLCPQEILEENNRQISTLIRHFWPGPLTLILPKLPSVPDSISAGLPTVAVRMPNHPAALSLIQYAETPIAAPSANLSGKPSPTTAEHVLEDLNGSIAAVIDGGPCTIGIESTVLDMTHLPCILRPGAVTQKDIEDVLGIPISHILDTEHIENTSSPGLKYKHYAPQTPIIIIQQNELLSALQTYNDAFFIANAFPDEYKHLRCEPLRMDTLFAAFRTADSEKRKRIIIVLDEQTRQHRGLMNRITKAAAETDMKI